MIGLIDTDSILYLSVYKVVSFSQIRGAYNKLGDKELVRQWLMEQVYSEAINRTENELLKMQNHLSEIFFQEIKSWELYITTCTNSFRKEISTKYKAKRKKNNYVWMVREHFKYNGAFHSDTDEADDLIARRVNELGRENCIVLSLDKDLKQIGGWLWNYSKTYEVDSYGDKVVDEYGNNCKVFKNDSVEWITQEEASYFFWQQMLAGDSGDGVTGIAPITKDKKLEIKENWDVNVYCRIGLKTAEKILQESKNYFIATSREYIIRGQKDMFWINYKLLKLE